MKKLLQIFIISLLLLSPFIISPVTAKALDQDCVRRAILAGKDPATECPTVSATPTTTIFVTDCSTGSAPECAAMLVRMAISVGIGVLFLVAVGYGIYGMIIRTTAGDNEEKLKESVKIFKNALLGIVITAVGLVIVQMISVLLGLGNIWEFNFSTPSVTCSQPQPPAVETPNCTRPYTCSNGRWVLSGGCQ